MAAKPKNPKPATKTAQKGKKSPENLPNDDTAEEIAVAAPKDDASAAAATDSQIPDVDEPAPAQDAGPPGTEAETSVPGAILAQGTLSPPPPTRSPATVGLVFGGLIAGAIGFLAATILPNAWSGQSVDENAALTATLEAQSARIDGLTDQVVLLAEGGDVDFGPVNEQTANLTRRVDQIGQQLDQISARLETLEARPIISLPDGSDAMAAQLDAFRSELDAVTNAARAEIEEAKARATEIETQSAATAADAQRRAALAEIDAALENGTPFAGALATLGHAPDSLAAVAEDGAPTLASLRATFPELARAALSGAEDASENANAADRLTAFLRRQTNARSLAPRDGDDTDAILSRVEAKLQDGALPDALGELETLPDASRAVLAPWIAQAESRAAAVSAFAAMSEILN